jgi:hypothetical protein
MNEANPYCRVLGIGVPRLETAMKAPDANYYALLIVALLERGEPITLEEAATRFEEAGVAPFDRALASLKRCRPARPPIYRDGDLYALDPHDAEADLWAFRLRLRPPKAAAHRVARPDPGPLPSPDAPLSPANLDEAWREGVPGGWSAQRVAVCVLDAHGAAMQPEEVVAFVGARSRWSQLSTDSANHWHRKSAIRVLGNGSWALRPEHAAVRSARQAVRERLVVVRRWAHLRPDPAVWEASRRRVERERAANAERLAAMRRVLVHAFPAKKPEAIVLVDVGRREITSFVGEEITEAKKGILGYDIIAAVDVRALLRSLDLEPGERRLGELGPPQKTKQLNRRGQILGITMSLLARGSCGISRPFADEKVLRGYLRRREFSKLRRRLEADARSLFALYQYGRLHGRVRLRWGPIDEMIPAPWVHRDEASIHNLLQRAHDLGHPLEVVVGKAPEWSEPWSGARLARPWKDGWWWWLVDEQGQVINPDDVQMARLAWLDGWRA